MISLFEATHCDHLNASPMPHLQYPLLYSEYSLFFGPTLVPYMIAVTTHTLHNIPRYPAIVLLHTYKAIMVLCSEKWERDRILI